MFIPIILLASIVIALARGGSLGSLTTLQTRHLWLFFIPLALQLIAFSPLGAFPEFGLPLVKILYLVSMAIAALALALNRHLPGLLWLAAGLTMNFLVIGLNGGLMPVSAAARQIAGMPALTGPNLNVIPMTAETVLPWLGDILPLPSWVPFANVFSPGDVLIAVGGVIFTQKALVPPGAIKGVSRAQERHNDIPRREI